MLKEMYGKTKLRYQTWKVRNQIMNFVREERGLKDDAESGYIEWSEALSELRLIRPRRMSLQGELINLESQL